MGQNVSITRRLSSSPAFRIGTLKISSNSLSYFVPLSTVLLRKSSTDTKFLAVTTEAESASACLITL